MLDPVHVRTFCFTHFTICLVELVLESALAADEGENLDRFLFGNLLFCAVGTPVIFTFFPVIVAAIVTIGTGDIFLAKTADNIGSANRIAAWIHCGL